MTTQMQKLDWLVYEAIARNAEGRTIPVAQLGYVLEAGHFALAGGESVDLAVEAAIGRVCGVTDAPQIHTSGPVGLKVLKVVATDGFVRHWGVFRTCADMEEVSMSRPWTGLCGLCAIDVDERDSVTARREHAAADADYRRAVAPKVGT